MSAPKKGHRYRVTLEELDADAKAPARLQFEFDNHDDIFAIVERLRGRDGFLAAGEIPPFALGLKLLGKTLMENRQHPLFSAFFPRFVEFMKELKKGSEDGGQKTEDRGQRTEDGKASTTPPLRGAAQCDNPSASSSQGA